MRYLILIFLTAAFASLCGCAARPSRVATGTRTHAVSDCPELEGYPDCQNGQHVDLAAGEHAAASTLR